MNTFTKISAVVGGAAFFGIFGWGLLIQVLYRSGIFKNDAHREAVVKVGVFILFCIFGYCCVPVMLRVFIAGQGKIGNGSLGIVQLVRDHFVATVLLVWAFFSAGLVLAVPAAGRDFFSFSPRRANSANSIRADLGMSLDEVLAASPYLTRKPLLPGDRNSVILSTTGPFDFELGESRLRFEDCHYFSIKVDAGGTQKVAAITLDISPEQTNPTELDRIEKKLRDKLYFNGWKLTDAIKNDSRDQSHLADSGEAPGNDWTRAGRLLHIDSRWIDDPLTTTATGPSPKFIIRLDFSIN